MSDPKVVRSVEVLTQLLDQRDLDLKKLIEVLVQLDKRVDELEGGGVKRPETREAGVV